MVGFEPLPSSRNVGGFGLWLLTQNLRQQIFQHDDWPVGCFKEAAGPEHLDSHESFALREVQGNILREPNHTALVFPRKEANVERIYFLIVCDFHGFDPPQK